MSKRLVHSLLLLGNVPVALFTAAALFAGLFGLASPEPNPARWVAIASPFLLAAMLATATSLFRSGHEVAALCITALPIAGLVAILFWAVAAQ